MTQLWTSCLRNSWARMPVKPISVILSVFKYIVAGLSFFLVISIRSGSGSLQVMMAGSGKRPSILMLGGGTSGSAVAVDAFRKSPGFSGTSMLGLNWWDLLAYDSRLLGGGRGCSIGRNTIGQIYRWSQQVTVDSFLAHWPVQSRDSTYCSEILLIERRSLHGNFHVVKYFCFPWNSIERRWKGFLHMIVCVSCQFEPQGIETCKQRVVVRAVIVEGYLTLVQDPIILYTTGSVP